MKYYIMIYCLLLLDISVLHSQPTGMSLFSQAKPVFDKHSPELSQMLSQLPARCVGPDLDGRVSCFAVYEKDPWLFYVGSASGGVYRTFNGGRQFNSVFDKAGPQSIGAIAVDQNYPGRVWVGTGESWQRNDVGWGDGIYKSSDSGRTWKNIGLKNANSIAKIVLHPTDTNIVYAAVVGSPWGYGPDRGIYKTTNGGKTWQKILFVNERTGAGDLVMDPKNPNHLLAGMWDHQRLPYHFRHGGPGSGIYQSKDGGKTWKKISKGLPLSSKNIGRISISFFPQDPRHVAAMIEERAPGSGFYKSINGGESWKMMPALHQMKSAENWGRPFYDNNIVYHPTDVNKIYHANPWHYTEDGGKTFKGTTYDNHGLWIDPHDPRHMLFAEDNGLYEFRNAGELPNKRAFQMGPTGQFYGVGYDMRKPYWVFGNMQDLGAIMMPTQTAQGNTTLGDIYRIPGSEGGTTIADPNDEGIIYSTTNDAGLVRYDRYKDSTHRLAPMKGFDYWPGSYSEDTSYKKYMNSSHRLRVGWNYGIEMSPHDSKTLYYGANYLFKTTDRGDTWKIISPDLTNDKKEWQIPHQRYLGIGDGLDIVYQTIRTIAESPIKKGIIWVGTDDGNVQLTLNEGQTWTNLISNIKGVPSYTWVSHIDASKFAEGRAYITFDGHRNFDLNTYVYVTEDYGKTWININSDLPKNLSCYVIKEGIKNPDLLYLGTEHGLYISLNRGNNWTRYEASGIPTAASTFVKMWTPSGSYEMGDFPTMVSIHDLQIHPREFDLIVGTHGRSIWTIPVGPLEEMNDEVKTEEVHFFKPATVYFFKSVPKVYSYNPPIINSIPNSQPGTLFCYYLKETIPGEATIEISDNVKTWEKDIKGTLNKGLNVIRWPLFSFQNMDQYATPPVGIYKVVLRINGKEYTQHLTIEKADN